MILILAVIAAAVGIVLIAAGKINEGFLAVGGGLIAAGVGLLAFPRAGRGAAAFSQVGGGHYFALGLVVLLHWV